MSREESDHISDCTIHTGLLYQIHPRHAKTANTENTAYNIVDRPANDNKRHHVGLYAVVQKTGPLLNLQTAAQNMIQYH